MPAKNIDHDAVRDALIADGWTITDDPLSLKVGDRDLFIDIAAERPVLAAEKAGDRIAVEIQSFRGPSAVADLQQAVGQFALYRAVLDRQQPDRRLYLAVTEDVYNGILSEPVGLYVAADESLRFLLYDATARSVIRWIN